MTYRYRVTKLPRSSKDTESIKTAVFLAIYNQYTGQTFYADIDGYYLQDGDIIQTDPSYYLTGDNAPDTGGGPPIPIPDFSFAVDAEPVSGDPTVPDIIVYDPNAEPLLPNPAAAPEDNYYNYPGDYASEPPQSPETEPGSVEVDLSFFDSYEQYYDENEDPVYTGSACDTSIGIRG